MVDRVFRPSNTDWNTDWSGSQNKDMIWQKKPRGVVERRRPDLDFLARPSCLLDEQTGLTDKMYIRDDTLTDRLFYKKIHVRVHHSGSGSVFVEKSKNNG